MLVAALFAALPLILIVAPTSQVHADNGLTIESVTTYTIDADVGVVHVSATMTFKNTVPDSRDGNVISRAYFSTFRLPAPVGAINAVATTSNGTALRVEGRLVPDNIDYFVFDVDFASDLFFGDTTNITVTYDITGFAPRSPNPSRVNPAYAAFNAFGIGDSGQVTVRVIAPKGFLVETFGNDVVEAAEGDTVVYTATDIAEPDEFELFVSARNDRALSERDVVTAAGNEFRLRSWPNDPEWADFTADLVDRGVAELAELIGAPWPIDGELEVREAFTPYLYGYAGWFSAADREIEIGEDLDQDTVLHELSHAWFTTSWFSDRWINEGLAQAYAARAGEALGSTSDSPAPITTTDPGRVSLNNWGDPDFVGGADEVEAYGYNASWVIIDQIVDEVGDEAMQRVFAAADQRTVSYLGDVPAEPSGFETDWRRLLDLLVELAGSTDAEDLISQYVVTDAQRDELATRAQARTAYAALVEAGGDWAPPLGVRSNMSNWEFDTAEDLITDAGAILALRDQLTAISTSAGASVPASFETDYESATDELDGVRAEVADQLDAATTLLAAIDEQGTDRGLFDSIGLIGTDLVSILDEGRAALAAGDTDAARTKAQEVVDTLDKAPDLGKQRGLLALGAFVLLAAVGLTLVVRRRRRRRLAEADRAAFPAVPIPAVPIPAVPIPAVPIPAVPIPAVPIPAVPIQGLWEATIAPDPLWPPTKLGDPGGPGPSDGPGGPGG